jgi:hypothetical protein
MKRWENWPHKTLVKTIFQPTNHELFFNETKGLLCGDRNIPSSQYVLMKRTI